MLPTLQLPQCCLQNSNSLIQLHGFCDASIRAYGCCLHVRSEGPSNITVRLWISKSRVAPVMKQSLSKLELCAAHLLAQQGQRIVRRKTHTVLPLVRLTNSTPFAPAALRCALNLRRKSRFRNPEFNICCEMEIRAHPKQPSRYCFSWFHCHRTGRINMVHRSSVIV